MRALLPLLLMAAGEDGPGPGGASPLPSPSGPGDEPTKKKATVAELDVRVSELGARIDDGLHEVRGAVENVRGSVFRLGDDMRAFFERFAANPQRPVAVPMAAEPDDLVPTVGGRTRSDEELRHLAHQLSRDDAGALLRFIDEVAEEKRWAALGISPTTHVIADHCIVCTYDGQHRTELKPGQAYEIAKFDNVTDASGKAVDVVAQLLKAEYVHRPRFAGSGDPS